jgi:hypothetical protein
MTLENRRFCIAIENKMDNLQDPINKRVTDLPELREAQSRGLVDSVSMLGYMRNGRVVGKGGAAFLIPTSILQDWGN